jgi:hypothetical protein
VTDVRQESHWKRWFTSVRAIAIAAFAAIAAVAVLLNNIKTIATVYDDWFGSRKPHISIRDLKVRETYPADLYDLDHQDFEGVWAGTIPPADRGYVAKLEFYADKTGGDAVEDCIVEEVHGTKPMWEWLDPAPPINMARKSGDNFYLSSKALRWIGADYYSVHNFGERREDGKPVKFEIFFREKQSIQVRLVCDWPPRTTWLEERKQPTNWLQEELNETVKSAPRAFRVRGGYPRKFLLEIPIE